MSLIGSNLPRQRLGNFDAQTGSLVLDEHFRDPSSTHRGVSMDGKTWPHGFRSDAFPHGAVSSRSPARKTGHLVFWRFHFYGNGVIRPSEIFQRALEPN